MIKKLLVIFSIFMLVGCNGVKKAFLSTGKPSTSPACETNTYLKAYHCSIAAVQANASRGNPDAEYALGYMYYYGIGTSRNTELALVWIKKAAAQHQNLAVKALAMMDPAVKIAPAAQSAASKTVTQSDNSAAASGLSRVVVSSAAGQSGAVKHSADTITSTAAPIQLPIKSPTAQLTGYTLQLMMSHSLSSISGVTLPSLAPGQKVKVFENQDSQGVNYLLTVGHFATKEEARQALSKLPLSLRNMSPWVRSLQGLKLASNNNA